MITWKGGEGGSGDDDWKKSSLFEHDNRWHHQLPHRVTPTLVTPLPHPNHVIMDINIRPHDMHRLSWVFTSR